MKDVLAVIAAWQRGDLAGCHAALVAWKDYAGERWIAELLAERLPRDLLAAHFDLVATDTRRVAVLELRAAPAQKDN